VEESAHDARLTVDGARLTVFLVHAIVALTLLNLNQNKPTVFLQS
jgi:hypothetical protein